jgi:hypothetical protein
MKKNSMTSSSIFRLVAQCLNQIRYRVPYISLRGVGCMDVGEALLPYRNATNIFLQISKRFSYFKILINLRTYITYNENIASFNVSHKPFIRIYQLFSRWI